MTKKKDAALMALVQCNTITEAANNANVSKGTIYNYLKDSNFRSELKRLIFNEKYDRFEKLQSVKNKALEALDAILETGTNEEKLKAARLILDSERVAGDNVICAMNTLASRSSMDDICDLNF